MVISSCMTPFFFPLVSSKILPILLPYIFQTLRVMRVSKRNEQKRHREDSSKDENEEKSSVKRPKADGITAEVISTKMVDEDASPNNKKQTGKEDSTSLGLSEGVKMEDSEEDPEEDEELPDVALQHDSADEARQCFIFHLLKIYCLLLFLLVINVLGGVWLVGLEMRELNDTKN